MSANAEERLFVIDTDGGTDDAQAILMALNAPNVRVLAITCSYGNTSLDYACRNVLYVLDMSRNTEIPVYAGSSAPLTTAPVKRDYYHGSDGFGDVIDREVPPSCSRRREHAATALVELVNKYPGEVTLVCLGPLTNIALALRLDPAFGRHLRHCYMMGGAYGKGNVTELAEFNFHADAVAASTVLKGLRAPLTLVCWDLCLTVALPWSVHDDLRRSQTLANKFLAKIQAHSVNLCRNHGENYSCADEVAMALAINGPDIVTKSERHHVTVDTQRGATRGQLLLQEGRRHSLCDNDNTVQIVMDIDRDMYHHTLKLAINPVNK